MTPKKGEDDYPESGSEGLFSRTQKEGESEESEPVKKKIHVDKRELESLVKGLLEEGITSVKVIVKRLKRYRVDGVPVDFPTVAAIKRRWKENNPKDPEEANPSVVAGEAPKSISDEILKDMYERAKKEGDRTMLARIQDRVIPPAPSEKPIEARIVDAWLKEKESGGSNPAVAALTARLDDVMKRGGLQQLSADPQVAFAQVLSNPLQQGLLELNTTVREIAGLRRSGASFTAEQVKKMEEAEALIKKYQGIMTDAQEKYIQCPRCKAVVPRAAGQCYSCAYILLSSQQYQVGYSPPPQAPMALPPPAPAQLPASQTQDSRLAVPQPSAEGKARISVPSGLSISGYETPPPPANESWLEDWVKPEKGILHRLRNKIESGHDAEKTFAGAWGLMDSTERKKLLHVAETGVDKILDRIRPHTKDSTERELLVFYDLPSTKLWIERGMGKVREIAKSEGVALTRAEQDSYENEARMAEAERTRAEGEWVCPNCGKKISVQQSTGHYAKCLRGEIK